jgi:hypothetical protein
MITGVPYKFQIINLMKPKSLYNEGMKPLMYSAIAANNSIGWRRCGEQISYTQNTDDSDQSLTFTLSFTIYFERKFFALVRFW